MRYSLFFLLFLVSYKSKATPILRRVAGYESLSATGGYSTKGVEVGTSYGYYLSSNWEVKPRITSQMNAGKKRTFFGFLPEFVVYYSTFEAKEKLYVSLLAGTGASYQKVKNKGAPKYRNSWSMTIVSGIEIQYFAFEAVALTLEVVPRYILLGKERNTFQVSAHLGIKFLF